jgi:hypothetical protein
MDVSPRIRRRTAAALAATTFIVMASVGSCQMPQPKFPSLGMDGGAGRGQARGLGAAVSCGGAVPRAASTDEQPETAAEGAHRVCRG